MKVRYLLIFALFLWGCDQSVSPVEPNDNQSQTLQKGGSDSRYIVVLNQDISHVPDVANEMAKLHTASLHNIYKNSIKGFAASMSAKAASKLAADSRVKFIEKDKVVALRPPTDKPGKPPKDEDPPDPQQVPWGIDRVGGFGDGTGKTAWVIDSGIDLDHADLNVNVALSANFVTRGKNSADDKYGHGTHVAGTIAAINNEIDVVGVAAGASVVSVRVLDQSGSGMYSWVIAGVDYVAANGSPGDVANMSLGGPVSQALDDAVAAAAATGVYFVLSAGNESDDANNYSPGRTNGSNIFTISAINSSDVFASFSNYANPPVDYAAPGVNVLSTKKGGGTVSYSGTSMAAPHVAGLLLLGNVNYDGFAVGDPDGNPDPIAHR